MALSISPDGGTVAVAEVHPDTSIDMSILSMGGDGQTEILLQTEFVEGHSQFSPDGRWLAFISEESGQQEVYVRPYPNFDDGRWQISSGGGDLPLWGRDGRELFYLRRYGDLSLSQMVSVSAHQRTSESRLIGEKADPAMHSRARPTHLPSWL